MDEVQSSAAVSSRRDKVGATPETMQRALVSGATGLIGTRLCATLEKPAVLSRNPKAAERKLGKVDAFAWDDASPVPPSAVEGASVMYHLAGDPVAHGRLDAEHKARVRESRVRGTRNVVEALAQAKDGPKVLVCASASGIYGDRGDEVLRESSVIGTDFLAEVCQAWEDEARKAEAHGIRVVLLRIGIVLAKEGGALKQMLPPFRMGVGGVLGNGRQFMPWIHIDDILGLLKFAAGTSDLRGPINAVAPVQSTNQEFTTALGRAIHRPTIFRVPAFALRVGFGDLARVVLASQRVVPEVALSAGYKFKHADLDEALKDLLG
jgi:uncharacterized protein